MTDESWTPSTTLPGIIGGTGISVFDKEVEPGDWKVFGRAFMLNE